MKEQPEYSSLVTASGRECITCYGRDGTTASRSIDTEGGSATLMAVFMLETLKSSETLKLS